MKKQAVIFFVLLSFFSCIPDGGSKDENSDNSITIAPKVEPYKEIFPNGYVKIEGVKVDGERDGMWISYYESGIARSKHFYHQGIEDGMFYLYHENAKVSCKGEYSMDVKSGLWYYFDKIGDTLKVETFDDKGELLKKEFFNQ